MPIADVLTRWRRRPAAAGLIVLGLAACTALVVAVGGPPTPTTHLYYFVLIAAAVLYGPRLGMLVGAAAALLAEPGALTILGDHVDLGGPWILRGAAMVLVGGVTVSRQRDEPRLEVGPVGAKTLDHADAVHPGQAQVDERDVRHVFEDQPQAARSIARDEDFTTTRTQEMREQIARVIVVVDHDGAK